MPPLVALPPRPGIFVGEQTAGPTPPAIALYQRSYVLMIASSATIAVGVPTAIGSMDDLTNQFTGVSQLTRDSIECYLANYKSGLYVIRMATSPMTTVTVTGTAAGAKTITINGTAITYTAVGGDTATTIITNLITAINNNATVGTAVEAIAELNASGTPIYTNSRFYIRSRSTTTFTATAGTDLTAAAVAVPASPFYWDYTNGIQALETTLQTEPLGFLTCPRAFHELTTVYERNIVANTLESLARSLGCYAYIDPGSPTIINTAARAVTEFVGATAIRGHSAAWYPYLRDATANLIAPSVAATAIALSRYAGEGIHQPPAGGRYPLSDIGSLVHVLSNADLDLLATNRINPFVFKRGVGFVAFDTLTRSIDTNFRHINTRVILSCLEQSIQDTVDASGKLFEAIGGRGLFFFQMQTLIEGVVARFYSGDALYGVLADQAYKVRCTAAMQEAADLEAGIVNAEVYVVPAGTARQIRITVFRVQIGKLAETLAGVGA